MKILEFVDRYNNMVNQQLKDRFVKENVRQSEIKKTYYWRKRENV